MHRLLRNAGFAPAWIEERKDIDAELDAAQRQLSRGWALFGRVERPGNVASDSEWERSVAEFRKKVAELNKRISIYNLKAPAAVFHRRRIDADKVIEIVCKANC